MASWNFDFVTLESGDVVEIVELFQYDALVRMLSGQYKTICYSQIALIEKDEYNDVERNNVISLRYFKCQKRKPKLQKRQSRKIQRLRLLKQM